MFAGINKCKKKLCKIGKRVRTDSVRIFFAFLVQYFTILFFTFIDLCLQLDAFQTPSLRRQVEGFRAEIEQTRQRCQQLEESLDAERNRNAHIFENELTRNKAEITDMAKQHHQTILQCKLKFR